ncbi:MULTISPECIES: hemerythrin domain-containing protein [unclassified Roseitalea]|uniref:hemerythrin domain-containing protein n=1 Tax=unclassified Roseitalea TaxID=2639107 RepID=UPI00273DC481|nr:MULTISPECIES: hemerythrin domain-containing protein [unclassified Roseitalea]
MNLSGEPGRSTPPHGKRPVLTAIEGGAMTRDKGDAMGHGMDLAQVANTLEHHLNVQQNLCTRLEEVADGLPAEVRNDDCLALARSLYPIIHRSHQFEEQLLFPALRTRFADDRSLRATLDRLHGEHWEDEAFAEEVQHELVEFVAGRCEENVEKLGYMLRGFFIGLRRHLAFEREHILPMLRMGETDR